MKELFYFIWNMYSTFEVNSKINSIKYGKSINKQNQREKNRFLITSNQSHFQLYENDIGHKTEPHRQSLNTMDCDFEFLVNGR